MSCGWGSGGGACLRSAATDQDEHDEAEEKDDKDNGVDDGEPVDLELFRKEGFKKLLTVTVRYSRGGRGREGGEGRVVERGRVGRVERGPGEWREGGERREGMEGQWRGCGGGQEGRG